MPDDLKSTRPHWDRACALCGEPFSTTRTRKIYCSRKHAAEASYRARQERRRAARNVSPAGAIPLDKTSE